MKIAVTGPNGRVGRFMVQHHGLIPLYFDVRDTLKIARELDKVRPDVILNLAAKSDPDYCEVPEHWGEVIAVNFTGALNVYRAAVMRDIHVVQMSTAHVFADRMFRHRPHTEDEPIVAKKFPNRYAFTKYSAEAARLAFPAGMIKIVRTSHLFDYVQIMRKLGPLHVKDNTVVYDAPTFMHRSYMYLPHFGEVLNKYLNSIMLMPDVLHIAGTDTVSEYDLMQAFVTVMGMKNMKIVKRRHDDPTHAPRPHWAGLDVTRSKHLKLRQYSYIDGLVQMDRDNVRG